MTTLVAIWRALDMRDQASLIGTCFRHAGFHAIDARVLSDGSRGDPLVAVTART